MIYIISDLHFNSENIIHYCGRPFANADDAREQMIQNWNAVVTDEDTVYVLGDFIMGSPETVPEILARLNGHIVLVRGNHDTKAKLAQYAKFPEKIEVKDIAFLSYGGLYFVMCHFPLTSPEFLAMVQQDNSEVVVLYGHVHDKVPFFTEENHTFNVSADVVGFIPQPISRFHKIVKTHFIQKGVWGKPQEGDT